MVGHTSHHALLSFARARVGQDLHGRADLQLRTGVLRTDGGSSGDQSRALGGSEQPCCRAEDTQHPKRDRDERNVYAASCRVAGCSAGAAPKRRRHCVADGNRCLKDRQTVVLHSIAFLCSLCSDFVY